MIRYATMKDADEIMRIGNMYASETVLGALTVEQMQGLIGICINSGAVLLAEREGKVVGIIAGRFVEGSESMGTFFEEILWYVDPNHRGIGIMLFKRMMDICEERKECKGISMWAYCNDSLEKVDGLYKRFGFKEIERKYYKKI